MATRKKAKRVRVIHTDWVNEDSLSGKIEDVISFLQDLKASMEQDGKTNIRIDIDVELEEDEFYRGPDPAPIYGCIAANVSYKFK